MFLLRQSFAVIGVGILLGACSFSDDSLLPSLTGSDPSESESEAENADAQGGAAAGDSLGQYEVNLPSVTPGQPTGTFVGEKVQELRGQLGRLQSTISRQSEQTDQLDQQIRNRAQAYNAVKAEINARLQVGTTPGNPELEAKWSRAQNELDGVSQSVERLNDLSNAVARSSSQATFLLESVRATYTLSGAVDEDHRQLSVLEDETNRTVVQIDRLLNNLTDDLGRQTNYLATERANLTTMSVAIKNGEYLGGSLANRAFGIPATQTASGDALVSRRQPLVVIRFDQENVDYEQALYTAVNNTLEQRPNSAFDLVGVVPAGGSSAQVALSTSDTRRRAEAVMSTLARMGMPASRMSLSTTTSQTAQVSEVHVYVR